MDKYTNKNFNEVSKLLDKSLEVMLKMQIEFEIGTITNAKKKRGKKYEDGIISYDGDYLEGDVYGEKSWYCHGYGKSYYEDGSLEYEGNYLYGSPHGYGKYYYRNGNVKWTGIFQGIYSVGKYGLEAIRTAEGYADIRGRIKYGKKYNTSGKLEYQGEFNLGKPEGGGTLYNDEEELIFIGEFKDGEPVIDYSEKWIEEKKSLNKFNAVEKYKDENNNLNGKITVEINNIIEEFKVKTVTEVLDYMDNIYIDMIDKAKDYFSNTYFTQREKIEKLLNKELYVEENELDKEVQLYIEGWIVEINEYIQEFIVKVNSYEDNIIDNEIKRVFKGLFFCYGNKNKANNKFLEAIEEINSNIEEYYAIYVKEFNSFAKQFMIVNSDNLNCLINNSLREKYSEYVSNDNINDKENKVKLRYIDKYKELNKLAEDNGYVRKRANGGHGIYIHAQTKKIVIIPQGRTIGKGLSLVIQRSILDGSKGELLEKDLSLRSLD